MYGLVELVFNLELTLVIGIVTSFILGFLLLLIKVPNTDYSRKIARAKNTISACFFVCSVLMFTCLRHSGMPDYDRFSSLMMFVITAVSSVVLSYSLINVLEDEFIDIDKFYLNLGSVVVFSFLLMKSLNWDTVWARNLVLYGGVVLFLANCAAHVFLFRKVYAKCVMSLEQYYDEEYDQRLRWIKFCYVIMMLTQMFILVYRLFPTGFMKVYNVWYSLFMLYFTANFISFLGSHKLTLDAFAYKALSGQDMRPRGGKRKGTKASAEVAEDSPTDIEFRKIERAIEQWVKQKKYVEYDKSREDVATEMNTTREMLHLYFTTRMGMDFKTWRTGLRIEEAKKLLLKNKDVSTNLVGEMAGFSDRSNFHRQFVKIVGCSPKQYRDSGGKI